MLIPLGTDRPSKRRAVVTPTLIALNIIVFLFFLILSKFDSQLAIRLDTLGAISAPDFHAWQPLTSAFMHAGFMHIFGNMIFLLAFGPSVEDRFGRVGFLLFYLAGAAASGLAHIALSQHPAVGASGAIAAVAGAFLVLFPSTKIRSFVIFFYVGIFMIPSWWLIGLFICLDLGAQLFTPANGIANLAHLGGYGFGITIALVLLVTHILPREPYDLFSILKHKKRRADFKAAQSYYTKAPVRADNTRAHKPDPRAEQIARARALVGESVSSGDLDAAADQYITMLAEFEGNQPKDHTRSLTMHRQAQYQIANHLYQRGQRRRAADAFARLLDAYPADPERQVITVLLARIHAQDLDDPITAIELLEELGAHPLDDETKQLVDDELAAVRSMTTDQLTN